MNGIFAGLFFVFFNFTVDFGMQRVGLLPDFVGFILIVVGLAELAPYGPLFVRAKTFAFGMAFYTGFLYMLDLTGLYVQLGEGTVYVLHLLGLLVMYFITYQITFGIKDIETERRWKLKANSLCSVWVITLGMALINQIGYRIPALQLLLRILSIALYVVFLFFFNQTRILFYRQSRGKGNN